MYAELVKQINQLQKQIDGLIKPEVGRWIDWTPTVTQDVAVTVTVTEAKYKVSESGVRIYARLTATSAGTAANTIFMAGWPAAINPSPGPAGWPVGVGIIVNAGTTYGAICRVSATTSITFLYPSTNNLLGTNPNFALANGNTIFANMYWKI